MKIKLLKQGYLKEEGLIYPISIEGLKEMKGIDSITEKICQIRELGDFKAKKEESYCLYLDKLERVKRVILIGLGEEKAIDQELVRRLYSIAIKKAQGLKIKTVATILPQIQIPAYQFVRSAVESTILSSYAFQKYITDDEKKSAPISSLNIYCNGLNEKEIGQLKQTINESKIICKYVNLTRDLVNENSSQKYSTLLSKRIKEICLENKLEVKELDEKELKRLNMNLLLAVNSGADHPPALLVIQYNGLKDSSKTIAFVGKGVTFDSGGLNLKPSGHIETMKLDMAGAATVTLLINCAAELGLKQNIIAVIPIVENMIGPKAYKPGDVFESYSKKTVEIQNTDAEGRLILADALSYTIDRYKPSIIIDLSTLTGACLVALGEYYAGAMTNNQDVLNKLIKSSENTNECVWQLPLYDDLAKGLKSDIADIKNVASKKYGGTIIGGLFLKEFVKDIPWVHLDIAGTAFFEEEHYYIKKGATGFGIRLLIDFLKNI